MLDEAKPTPIAQIQELRVSIQKLQGRDPSWGWRTSSFTLMRVNPLRWGRDPARVNRCSSLSYIVWVGSRREKLLRTPIILSDKRPPLSSLARTYQDVIARNSRNRSAMIFQERWTALNPVVPWAAQLTKGCACTKTCPSRKAEARAHRNC